jgi:hypothetical protein
MHEEFANTGHRATSLFRFQMIYPYTLMHLLAFVSRAFVIICFKV